MRIGNRNFPYPVFNRNPALTSYKTSLFQFLIANETGKKNPSIDPKTGFLLKGACFATNSDRLRHLIEDGKASVVLIIECSETLFRKKYILSETPQDIVIPAGDIHGRLECSVYGYLNQEIIGFIDPDFIDDYSDLSYALEKGDIIAADDGFGTKVQLDETESDYVPSIITVVRKPKDADQSVSVDLQLSKIVIGLAPDAFEKYYNSKDIVSMRPIYFSFLLVPAMAQVFSELKKSANTSNFDNFSLNYNWFESLQKSYAKVFGHKLDGAELDQLDPLKAAQALLNYPINEAIDETWILANTHPDGEE